MGEDPLPTVFISYSHRDAGWLNRLKVHLTPLFRDSSLSIWDDTKIRTGTNWRDAINDKLDAAKVAVLLISADYLASDFIFTSELPQVLERARTRNCAIIPIVIKPCVVLSIRGLRDIEFANPPSKPLLAMTKVQREAELAKIACAIYDATTIPNPGVCMTSSSAAIQAKTIAASVVGEDSKFIYERFLNVWETQHLRKLVAGEPFPFTPRKSFEQELRRLLEAGLIEREPGRGVRTAMRDDGASNDLRAHFHATADGRKYIDVLAQLTEQKRAEQRQ
jgi:hypothetical protein